MSETAEFDRLVGQIAGAIYMDILHKFPHPPLVLVPALTFKVRKVLEQFTDVTQLSEQQKSVLAKDIQESIVPMLFSYEIHPDIIKEVTPDVGKAALKVLTEKN